ncbi:MAG: rhamnogalacturonan acetylesterase, partial [Verrucomicrobiales bacterium]|nr:rhamnogalacturonan acetylesterase [Verrucomicrobiales bacterium]
GENKENADLVVSPYPSDHRAVVATFLLPDQTKPNPAADQAAFEKAEADTTWAEVFSDSGTADWQEQWFLDGEVGTVTNSPEGMTLTAGPEFKNDAHHMVLWTEDSFSGDLKIEYDYTRLDEAPNCVTILYLQATGSGKGPYAKDITKWSDLRKVPAMKMYFNHMNTYHMSYAAFPESKKAYLRGRRYLPENEGLNGTELKPDYSTPTLFATGVKHHITVIKKDRDLHVRVANPDEVLYFHMNNPDLPAITEGRIGLRHMFTRSARYADFRVSQPASRGETVTIGLIGDSTVAEQSGWGPAFTERFDRRATILNYAKNGATLESLSAELDELVQHQPDYVLIQFGHNDQKRYDTAVYQDRLKSYVERIQQAGAQPVIVSSVTRRSFDADGKIVSNLVKNEKHSYQATLTDYAEAAEAVAEESNLPFLDLHRISIAHHNQIGPEASMTYNFKEGDLTHFNRKGAEAIAGLIFEELETVLPEMATFVKKAG